MKKAPIVLVVFLTFLFSCKKDIKRGLVTNNAMVVSARVEASKIGSDILEKGGNAFDAMVATELALAVVYPCAGNIGGGGFMVYRKANGAIGSLDYREKAPKAATKNMYLDSLGHIVPDKSTKGAMAIGVPGTVAGVMAVHKKLGSLPLETILKPVIELAEKGYAISRSQAERIKSKQNDFRDVNKDSIIFINNFKPGDTLKQPALAQTLKAIMNHGKEDFYKGETAKTLVRFIQNNGGILTLEDMANYEAQWRKPITFNYDDLKIISMAPPSSGGVCLGQIMKMIEPYDLHNMGHNSLKSIQVITEAEKRAYADRSFYLGDPDFVNIPTKKLLDTSYLNHRMSDFSFNKSTPSAAISHGHVQITESNETTHYSIIDQFGNAVSTTTTLNSYYGSKLYCSELGFFLNNEMDDFSSKPGIPNLFGLIGAEANSIAPEKRMLSSMTPTIVEKNGKLFMAVGTPGGSTIITSVLQTILNVHEFGMGMQEAVNAPRFHHQWLPDEITMEPNAFNKKIINKLETLGYKTIEEESIIIGKVDGILVTEEHTYEGGADHRGDDTAVGF
ncbi:gamma-glutamyltransferase [Pseudotamlana carrageenivorans]|uniref:Glutathione hydrolase proenzyme n=1 Tax=Pseudotamlana carrageenivorans TaxID=2069432 RepID=A0A2I7SLN1_9FLAO|nr:gamma-glutamyltransferase [Tamlana carrageenivorans]AUS06816.1 gamma-glutamyltransferase [Tamlana carrageenivorans]